MNLYFVSTNLTLIRFNCSVYFLTIKLCMDIKSISKFLLDKNVSMKKESYSSILVFIVSGMAFNSLIISLGLFFPSMSIIT